MTNHHRPFAAAAVLLAFTLGAGACTTKTPAKSTTTTRTQSETTNSTGDKTSSDTKETTTQQLDGSSTVQRTETTNTRAPAPPTK